MKSILIVMALLIAFGTTNAQSLREDITLRWPKAEIWELEETTHPQTDFFHREQKWTLKQSGNNSLQKTVLILNDDITKTMVPLDSIKFFPDQRSANGAVVKLLAEKKNIPHSYKLFTVENRRHKSEPTPISSLIYITDGKACRHVVLVSQQASKLSSDLVKQWSEILLNSRIIPTKAGNFEYTDDATVELKQINGAEISYVVANFKSEQLPHLKKGQPVSIIIDDLHEFSLSGKITEISSTENKANKSPLIPPNTTSGSYVNLVKRLPVSIEIEVPATLKDKIKNGMICTVKVATAP